MDYRHKKNPLPVLLLAIGYLLLAFPAHAVSLSSLVTSPQTGAFTVGSTFDVSIFLNTAGESINAIDSVILFPPDKLQVVSPSAGRSIIEIYTAQPSYDNQEGIIRFQGGIPSPGINVESGVISTITFRVKSTGNAVIRFGDESKVFLNDGLGTNVLGKTTPAIYDLVLPPPAGPIVSSPSHPDQARWYSSDSAILDWTHDEKVQGYSYVLNSEPIDLPDDISEGTESEVIYRNLPSGIHYFHIKALRSGSWGGVTHFALNIDAASPAGFPIEIVPGARTTRRNVVISFVTTDKDSGMDHYEIKLARLAAEEPTTQPFFIEATSPFVTTLELGTYEVTVRAYDNAGNFTEAKTRIEVVRPFFEIITGTGVRVGDFFVIPWIPFFVGAALVLMVLSYGAWRAFHFHRGAHERALHGALKDPVIAERLKELEEKKKKKKKSKKKLAFILAAGLTTLALGGEVTRAALPPPLITAFSDRLSDEEFFYAGGKLTTEDTDTVLHVQNIETGEAYSFFVPASTRGDWLYTHNTPLSAGRYRLWAQAKMGEELSPPSPPHDMVVTRTALTLGERRITAERAYGMLATLFGVLAVVLAGFMTYHFAHGAHKHRKLTREIRELERQIQEELEEVHALERAALKQKK